MSTMKKRIPMFLLALAMMVAMALPTFADEIQPRANLYSTYSVRSVSQGRFLHGYGTLSSKVFLSSSGTKWTPGRYGATTKLYLNSTIGSTQMVICYSAGNIVMASETQDDGITAVSLPIVTSGINNISSIYFYNRNAYVTALDSNTIQTAWLTGNSNQNWAFLS